MSTTKTPPRIPGCVCAYTEDGEPLPWFCPKHADTDPCLQKSLITGKRRKGTIRRGVCTNCGWTR